MTSILQEARETGLSFSEPPGKTWRLDLINGRVGGQIDGLEAVVQSAMMALATERYEHLIFSWQYGSELHSLLSRDRDYVFSEARRMIREALSPDTRITDVRNFDWRDGVIHFTVDTIFGSRQLEQEVMINA